jgi:ATP-dependent Clp protease adaptor protein ClpS
MSQQPSDRPPVPPDPAAARPKGQAENKQRTGSLPPYKVILHHDAANDLMFVVRTVMELTRLCRHEATHKMWEAYHCGRSLLLTTHRERAELYVDQFASKGLTVSVEPG